MDTIALLLSQNGLVLSTGATAILILIVFYGLYLNRREKRSLLTLYRKLPSQDQLIIKAVSNAQNMPSPTTKTITLEYQKLSQTSASEDWVAQKLNEAEKAGLIKKILVSKEDKPALLWKNQIYQKTFIFNWPKSNLQTK